MRATSFLSYRLGVAQLVGIGVHVGHSLHNSSLYAAWLIYGYRAGVCLINLCHFISMLRFGFNSLNLMVAQGRPIWFVNKDKSFARYVRYYALKCGEFASTLQWVRGMLSNFKVVGTLAKKYLILPRLAQGRKLLLLDSTLSQWFLTRYTWPGLVFVSSIISNYFVVNEAFHSSIPCMGIADTDALAQGCSVTIPGNDDSLDSVVFYHDLLAEYVLYRKFSHVYLWFLNVRRSKRLVSFYE